MGRAVQGAVMELSFKVVKGDLDQSKAAITKLNKELNETAQTANRIEGAFAEVRPEMARLTRTIRDENEEIARQNQLLKGNIDSLERRSAAGRGGSGGGTLGGAERAGLLSTGLSSVAAVAPGPAGDVVRLGADIAGLIEQLPRMGQALTGVSGSVGTVGTAAAGAGIGLGTLAAVVLPLAAIAAAAAVGFIAINAALEEGRLQTQAYIAASLELAQLRASGTTEEAEAAQEQARLGLIALEIQRQELEARRQDITNRSEFNRLMIGSAILAANTITETLAIFDSVAGTDLAGGLRELVENRLNPLALLNVEGYNDLATALEENVSAVREEEVRYEELTRMLEEDAFAANDAAQASEDLAAARQQEADAAKQASEQQRASVISATERYNADIQRINTQHHEAVIQADQRYADKQVQIAQQAADAAEAALQRLIEQQTRLQQTFVSQELNADETLRQSQLDERIKFQRDEAQSARSHANDLLDIQRRAQDQEFDLTLGRDFAGISRLRRETSRQLAESNLQFARDREVKLEQYAISIQDERDQFVRERAERLQQFRQSMSDAQSQYSRELQLAYQRRDKELQLSRSAHQAELSQLSAKITAELDLRNRGIVAELQMLTQSASVRLQIERQLFMQAQQMLAAAGGTTQNVTVNNNISGSDPTSVATEVNKQMVTTVRRILAT